MRRSENGITLIALIITIIILVILAAVSINAVYNMGIVGHAINGTQQYAERAKEENDIMDQTGKKIEDAVSKVKEIQGESNSIITFYLDGIEQSCKKGQTWKEWAKDSEVNNNYVYSDSMGFEFSMKEIINSLGDDDIINFSVWNKNHNSTLSGTLKDEDRRECRVTDTIKNNGDYGYYELNVAA